MSAVEAQLHAKLPTRLAALYRLIGGMTLFTGSFRAFAPTPPGIRYGDHACQPGDLMELNHELDAHGWRPSGAVAFAVNA